MSAASKLAGQAVKVASVAVDVLIRPPRGVVVLAYHQVGAPGAGSVNLPASLFDEQMSFLADQGPRRRVVDLTHAIDAILANDTADPSSPTPPGATDDLVVITFDDGTADFVEVAVPILEKYQLPATLYLATDFVERGISFWDDGTVLSWGALRDVLGSGRIGIGSHTHTHALLDRIEPIAAASDLDRSIDLIGERLGIRAEHFAYPKALPASPAIDPLVRERFRSAAVAGGRPNPFGDTDVWRLSRTPIVVADGTSWFERKVRGGLRLEGALRERLDQRRYAEASR